ncbi:MAG: UDP-N-acetylmuramoyl-L-alanine--D-glutamate ligase [Balneolaceae bacterium]
MINLNNKHIVVAGAARSGIAVALLIKNREGSVFVSDSGSIKPDLAKRLDDHSILYEENKHSKKAEDGDFLVLSPGIPTTSVIAQSYLTAGKSVYSEIEIASWFNKSPIVAITGSNGKTTVVNWMANTWKKADRNFVLAGNVGTAFSEVVDQTDINREALLEISSFQLDHIDTFRPHVSAILNITPDHLDRYNNDFEKYAQSKLKITSNQTKEDWFIYNADDPLLTEHAKSISEKKNAPKLLAFSTENEVEQGVFIRNNELIFKINHKEEILMQIGEIGLPGKHNLKNGMATALAARASEIKKKSLRESLQQFEGVSHRLETVRVLNGVRYINDSKATNINAVWYALDSFEMPIVLILGGRDKGNDYLELESQIREKVHTVVSIGEAKQNIKKQLEGVVPHLIEADTLKHAVKAARNQAKRGEIVLLSPACSSFDMFENYEDRGNQFKQAVIEL